MQVCSDMHNIRAQNWGDSGLRFGWRPLVVWCLLTCLWPTFAECWLISHAGVLCLCVCVIGRRTTTTSTQSATAQDLGGGWPSRRALGPALDYQSQCAALSAVSICVYLSSLSVAWNFHHYNLTGYIWTPTNQPQCKAKTLSHMCFTSHIINGARCHSQ